MGDPWRDDVLRRLDGLSRQLETLASVAHRIEHSLEIHVMADLSRLTQEVSENTAVINSAITLINGLAEQIRALSTDPAALNALADQLDAQSNALASAVAENTPAEEPPTP